MARIPSPAAAHIGATVTSLRKSRGLTIDDLASKTRIDSANIRSYEAGRALVGLHSLVKIATALDVEPGLLLEGVELSMFESASPRRESAAIESSARA
ncbi:helix-turn-helix domain-containing protein [Leucobacter sp. L43]|uniref:helix-turn-helix domain-containing protein n=1 Tax=Leucobacter sp. L43 TaxID=2798040 RepID=UPI0019036173|nr:helix-turn-helix transcriptional regulator [Leucobacter sp. L43]